MQEKRIDDEVVTMLGTRRRRQRMRRRLRTQKTTSRETKIATVVEHSGSVVPGLESVEAPETREVASAGRTRTTVRRG